MDSLVTTDWLAQESGASDLRIVDASLHLGSADRDARAEFEAGHIPGAVFMDLESLVDNDSPVPGTLPSPEMFASRMQKLGLGDGSRIVLYDDSDIRTSARAWFMLRMFGAHHVAVLDGGIAKWKAEDRPLEDGKQQLRHRHYTAWRDTARLRTKDDILANIESGKEQLVDARSQGRFTGEDPEIRPGMPSGHVPGALNLPYGRLFNDDGTFKDADGIRAEFEEAGVDLDKPVITMCGSGITASVLLFALHLAGKDDVALYDGSWSEWAADPDAPKELGPAN
jgi:thiosulfate/3-mercaptopyruvate sulfurtransferase